MIRISSQEVEVLSKYIYSISGISLDESKGYLLETRLRPLLLAFGLHSFSELYYQASTDQSGELEKKVVDAISTQETLFFRDQNPFQLFKYKILPDLIDAKPKPDGQGRIPLRIWSAGCSTGQEVYSIGISLLEVLSRREEYEISILGTDISEEALAQASYGAYSRFEIERGLPRQLLQKYFTPASGGWRIKDEVRSLASFKKQNLMQPFGNLGKFDVVFCRNVAIYFAHRDKVKLFEKISRILEPGGYLIVGGSESLSGVAPQFETKRYLKGIYYQRRDQGALQPRLQLAERAFPSRVSSSGSQQPGGAKSAQPQKANPAPPSAAQQPGKDPMIQKSSSRERERSKSPGREEGEPRQAVPEAEISASKKPEPSSWRTKGRAFAPEKSLLSKLGRKREKKGGSPFLSKTELHREEGRSLLAKIQRRNQKAED